LNEYFFSGGLFMNKKGQKNGIIALLLIALMVFVGCPTGGGTDPDDPSNGGDTTTGGSSTGGGGGGGIDPTPADVKAAENLAIQINEDFGDKYIAWVPGKAEITLIKDLEIPKSETLSIQAASGGSTAFSVSRVAGDTENPLTIPSGVIFVVNAGRKLTVNSSGVVTNNGTIRVEKTGADVFGTIKVSGGTLTASGPITVAGAIEVTGGGSLEVKKEITVTGTLTVSGEEASVTVAGDATLTVEGNVEVATGGTLMVEGTITTGSESTIKVEGIITTGSESTITVEGNVEVATGGTLTVEGTITTGSESTIKVEGNVTGAGTIEGQGTPDSTGKCNTPAFSKNLSRCPVTQTLHRC
jgi:hypothetical protein